MPGIIKVCSLAAVLAARSVQHTGSSYQNDGRCHSWSSVLSCTGPAHRVYSWSASFRLKCVVPNIRETGQYYGPETCADEYLTCEYSPTAVLSTICVGVVMLAFLVVTGCFRFKNGGMPVAESCSSAISAACHSAREGQLGEPKMQRGGVLLDGWYAPATKL